MESLDIVPSEFASTSMSAAGNNSHYVDSNTAQRLSMDEVLNLQVYIIIALSLLFLSKTFQSFT